MAKKVAPPKVTGGGGFSFEDKVAAYFMACLLSGQPPVDPDLGALSCIDFQTRSDGWLLDDILLALCSRGNVRRCAFSVKSYAQFTKNTAPQDFVENVWAQFLREGTERFDRASDILGLISTPHGHKIKTGIEQLLNKARHQRPSDLATRLKQPGYASQLEKNIFASFSCPASLAQKHEISEEHTGALLNHLRLLEFDFESQPSSSEREGIQICRTTLQSNSLEEAQQLWVNLLGIAREFRPAGGHIDLIQIVGRLRLIFRLKDYPNHAPDWLRLEANTREKLASIPDKIGHLVSIPRSQEHALLKGAFARANTVVMLGPSGCGKTVVAKSWISELIDAGKSLWWNAKSFDIQDFPEFEGKHRLSYPLLEILNVVTSAEARVVIDAIDRVFSPEAFQNISTLLRSLQDTSDTTPWRIFITCQPEEWDRVRVELARANISTARWQVIDIKEPDEKDLGSVWDTFPQLRRLTFQLQLRSLLLKPKVLDLLATKLSIGGDVDTGSWVGESDLIEWFWQTEVSKPPQASMRANFLKRLAEKQADDLRSETPVDEFQTADQNPLDGLINDRLCNLRHERLSFSHDLYGDWARQRLLLAQSDNLSKYLWPRLGSPLWHRAIRLYGLHLLEKSSDLSRWKDVVNSLPPGEEADLTRDLLLEAAIFAADPLPNYERLWPELIANKGILLRRLLGRFIHVATVPNPAVWAFAQQFEPEAETQYALFKRIPYWPFWLPMTRFLHNHLDEVLELAPVRVAEIADTWLRQGFEGLPLRREMAEIAIAGAERVLRLKMGTSHLIIQDEVDKVIYRAGLAGARELPERVATFALEACARRLPNTESEASTRGSDSLRHVSEPPVFIGRRGMSLQPWPDGPRRPVDSAFQKLCLDQDTLEPLILAAPKVAREVLLAILIEDPEARTDHEERGPFFDNYGVERLIELYPPIYFRGPFMSFLRNRHEDGLEFILRFVNFATEVWASRHTRSDRVPPGVSINFQDDERKWIGNGNVYYWYCPPSDCPDSVMVALMSLEKWFYEELEAKRDVSATIETILRNSQSLAFAGLLSAVGRKEKSLFQGPLQPLLGVSEFLRCEQGYIKQQSEQYLMIGWQDQAEVFRKAAHDWHTLPHRSISLYDMAMWHFLFAPDMRPFFEQARSRWVTQLKSYGRKRRGVKDELELLIAAFDIGNYKVEHHPEQGERWVFVPPEKLRKRMEDDRRKSDETLPILSWPLVCRKILDTGQPLPEDKLEGLWKELLRISESPSLNDLTHEHQIMTEHAVCGMIAVLVLLHRPWLKQHPEREEWCVERLAQTVLNQPLVDPNDYEHIGNDQQWSSFCAQVLPVLWAEDPSSTSLRRCLALLAMNPSFRTVAILFASAGSRRRELGKHFRQLQHFLRRWSAEKLRHQLGKFRGELKPNMTDWLQGEVQAFVDGSMPPSIPSLKEIAVERRVQPFERDNEEWKCTRLSPNLNFTVIQAAYTWLPPIEQAYDEEERKEWITFWHECLSCTLEMLGDYATGDKEIDGLPYEWDRWVFNHISTLILHLRSSEQPDSFWKPILEIGPGGHHWLEDFFKGWFINGLAVEKEEEAFKWEWRAMAEFAFTSPLWNKESGRLWYNSRRIWWHLLGFNQDITSLWTRDQKNLVAGMRDVYKRWADAHLSDSHSTLLFAAFLRAPAAEEIVLDALVWIERNTINTDDEFWRKYNIQDVLAEALDICWRSHQLHLRQQEEPFTAYKKLLSKLAAFQNPLALEIQQRIATAH